MADDGGSDRVFAPRQPAGRPGTEATFSRRLMTPTEQRGFKIDLDLVPRYGDEMQTPAPATASARSTLSTLTRRANQRAEYSLRILSERQAKHGRVEQGGAPMELADQWLRERTFDKHLAEINHLLDEIKGGHAEKKDPPELSPTAGAGGPTHGVNRSRPLLTTGDTEGHGALGRSQDTPRRLRNLNTAIESKLDTLRRNPDELIALRDRIAKHERKRQASVRGAQRRLLDGPYHPSKFAPDTRRAIIAALAQTREERRREVANKREQIHTERHTRMVNIVRRRQIREEEESMARAREVELGKLQLLQRKWLALLCLGSRQWVFGDRLRYDRANRSIKKQQISAARIIQRSFRAHVARAYDRQYRWSMQVIRRSLIRWALRFKFRRQRKMATLITTFLKDMAQVTGFMKAVKSYRYAVTGIQRFWRRELCESGARLELLSRQYMRIEEAFVRVARTQIQAKHRKEQSREKALKNALVPAKVRKNSSASIHVQDRSAENTLVPKTTPEIRTHLLRTNLHMRRKQFVQRLEAYYAEVKEYEKRMAIEKARLIVRASLQHGDADTAADDPSATGSIAAADDADAPGHQPPPTSAGTAATAAEGLDSAPPTADGASVAADGDTQSRPGTTAGADRRSERATTSGSVATGPRTRAQAPRKPRLRSLLPLGEMLKLVEQGVRQTLEELAVNGSAQIEPSELDTPRMQDVARELGRLQRQTMARGALGPGSPRKQHVSARHLLDERSSSRGSLRQTASAGSMRGLLRKDSSASAIRRDSSASLIRGGSSGTLSRRSRKAGNTSNQVLPSGKAQPKKPPTRGSDKSTEINVVDDGA